MRRTLFPPCPSWHQALHTSYFVSLVMRFILTASFSPLNRVYVPCIYILNKIDQISVEELDIIYRIPHAVPISAHHKWNFDDLLEKMWEYLNLIRMYIT